MDSNTVSSILQMLQMPVEIKMDPHGIESRHNFTHLRTWTKSTVKVEAVKCFPCYMKLTVLNTDGENLSIRIHIPGLSVQVATSRTKQYSYGMFWKHNRKRCCAFLAFESQKDCEQHMKWVKYWIKCLEFHRTDMLVTRRITRSKADESVISNSTQTIKNISDVLGPLPPIPVDLDQEWIRRQSMNVSGIYEDIEKYRKDDQTFYEEIVEEIIPTLSPRQRANTRDFGIRRSQTNSAVDYKLKAKKSWTSQLMEGITKRFELSSPKSPQRKASLDKVDETKPKLRNKHFKSVLQKSKRNSFSSPDLFNIPDTINLERGSSFDTCDSWGFNFLDEPGKLNISAEILNCKRTSTETSSSGIVADFESVQSLNMCDRQPDFKASNASLDEPIYQVPKNIPVERFIDDPSGYCMMASPKLRRRMQPELQLKEECPYTVMDDARNDCTSIKESEPIYSNIETLSLADPPPPKTPDKKRTSRPPSCNFDEKIPSYYPNEIIYARPKKPSPVVTRTRAKNNIYTSPPIREAEPVQAVNAAVVVPDKKSQSHTDLARRNSFSPAIPKSKGRLKYATIGRSEVRRHPVQDVTHTTTTTLSRKFQSLPKFQFNLMPLRMKLNSVLQRYHQNEKILFSL